jgi:1,2-diacylglycerol-3-alpha-glucose alpha-1,2-galactosyltransferase
MYNEVTKVFERLGGSFMGKITINMLSKADSVKGQGVGSAYLEQVKLVTEGASDIFDIKINDKHDADINHHHTVFPFNYMRMKTGKGINVCYVHFLPETLDGSINLPKIAFDAFKKYVVDLYKSADYLIVVNPIFIKELESHGINREKVKYIPNYVSKADFYKKSDKDKKSLRKELGIKSKDFVVLGVGQVQTRKGVLDFVEVAEKLPNVTFLWCGGFSFGNITDGYKELKKVVENPPANVKFLGIIPREKMNDMYNVADVLFMPSYNELFPMSILEASNVEIPILLRDLDLYKDILFDNYLIGNNNQEFVSKIKSLTEDKKLYNEYSLKSQNISNFYSKENVLKIWRDFYTGIYNKNVLKHLVFLSKTAKEMDNIIAGKKTSVIRGGINKKACYTRTKKGDILYFTERNNGSYIECKAIVSNVINTEKLTKEEALELILKHQNSLHLTASQIKKWAMKPYLTIIEFKKLEVIEPFKIYECDYINMENWLIINKKLDD